MGRKQQRETSYDVQPLRSREEINDFKWALRRFCTERDYFMFTFGINTGLRISDILVLQVRDVKGKTHTKIIEKKSGKIRNVNLSGIQEELEQYTQGMDLDAWLFPSRTKAEGNGHISETQAYRVLVKAAEQLGRKDIGTHTMRKTFGYHYYKKTKDVAALQELFNHSAPSITKRYIGITQDEIDETLIGFKL